MNPIVLNNRYRLAQRIGHGGMAYVYEAEDLVLKRKVAVKILKEQYLEDEEFVQKFENEALAAASLNHPNIVNVYDVGRETIEDRTLHYIVMELIEGTTLKEAIQAHGTMSSAVIAKTGRQIALALQRAHEHDLVHRDIKPANILITKTGDIKVADFGIARITSASTVTLTNNILGTVHYISPEQAKGQAVDAKSDIYSLGVVMYEMATGAVPFDAETSVGIAMKQIQEAPIPPIERNPALHPGLNRIILRCLEKNPSDRFASAEELADALDNYDALEDTMFLPPVTHAAVKPRVERKPDPPEAVYQSRGNIEPEEDNSKRPMMRTIALLAVVGIIALFSLLFFFFQRQQAEKERSIMVPAVINLDEQAALDLLAKNGLNGVVKQRKADDEIEKGVVIDQSIMSGTPVEKGTTINLVVSTGKMHKTVPNVAGLLRDDAVKQLQEEGFRIGQTSFAFDANVPKDQVVRTDPAANAQSETGARINLIISRGQEAVMTVVPVLINKTQNQALAAINEAGLKLGKLNTAFSTYPSGTVIAQSITAGTQVEQNSAISITVSMGKQNSDSSEANAARKMIYYTSIYPPAGKKTFEVTIYDLNESREKPVYKKVFHASDVNEKGYISAKVEALEGAQFATYIDGVPADTARQNTNGGRDK
ncbi:Stk1 family PASTA domain-containing Ser/Thr kinase [Levyella massiliensis]|uniref:Stk1 family PASTA domain-containing Ser/Thr kinase n=1 Tax=Levyella massiliensis TaxID=938289 RepID=UPI00399B681A